MRASRGFTLIEIVVVLLILGIVLAMAAAITRGLVASQKRSLTATRMTTVDAALVQFVMQQRRLPCPTDGSRAASNVNAGVEDRDLGGACTAMSTGVVAWRALGLTESEATDGWNRRLTYRVDPALALNAGMDMSGCDPAGPTAPTAAPHNCAPGCTSTNLPACTPPVDFLSGTASAKGLAVRNLAGTVLMNPALSPGPNTGAAYVVISSGESGGGGYGNTGTLMASTTTDGAEEAKNYANLALRPYYVDDTTMDAPGAGHFDDVVSRPSILSVASKAGVAPRSH